MEKLEWVRVIYRVQAEIFEHLHWKRPIPAEEYRFGGVVGNYYSEQQPYIKFSFSHSRFSPCSSDGKIGMCRGKQPAAEQYTGPNQRVSQGLYAVCAVTCCCVKPKRRHEREHQADGVVLFEKFDHVRARARFQLRRDRCLMLAAIPA